jgi:3(or 17)beta-hydroxysteroid dehydrogenase
MKLSRLTGKTILVTGAASGIGRACLARLSEEGATVLGADLNEEQGRQALHEIGAAENFFALDVTSETAWQATAQRIKTQYGCLHGIANVAGIAAEVDDLEGCSVDDWNRVLRVNLDGTFLGCQTALPLMREHGGSIVNIASIIGLIGDGNMMAYGASKGGVRLLSRSIAVYCCSRGYPIRCNSVHPGYIETPMVNGYLEQAVDSNAARAALIAKHPIGRLGKASEVAALVAFLLSEESRFVTGSELTVDGGYVAV